MVLTEKQIIARIRAHGRGFVFTTKLFSSLADDSVSVRTALTRLVQKKSIRRLSHGLYDLPIVHPQLGELVPSVENIIEAIKTADAIEVQATGAYAANVLGLSTQIPMRIELYTNGPRRKIRFGNQEILLKPTTPKNMVGAGTKAGLILHALRQIGQGNVTNEMIAHIKTGLVEQDIKHIKKQIPYAPAWIAKIMRSLINGFKPNDSS
jgi:hypothetical protein